MLDCLIVGDSIALGLGLRMAECARSAFGGVPSATVLRLVQPAAVMVVSAGSNDEKTPELDVNLWRIRKQASGRVIWILPVDEAAGAAVQRVARAFGDTVIRFAPGADHLHPASYDAMVPSVWAAVNAALTRVP